MGAYAAEGCFGCCAGFGGRFRLAFCACVNISRLYDGGVGRESCDGELLNSILLFIPLLDFDASFGAIAAVLDGVGGGAVSKSKSSKSQNPNRAPSPRLQPRDFWP